MRNHRNLQCVSLLIKQSERAFYQATWQYTVFSFITLYNIFTLIWSCRVAHNKKTQTRLSVMKCLKKVCEVGCMSCTTYKVVCEQVSDNNVHVCVPSLRGMSHTPPQSSITITSLRGISDRRRWLVLEVWCGGQAVTTTAQKTGLDMKAWRCAITDIKESDTYRCYCVVSQDRSKLIKQHNHAFLCLAFY